MKPPSAPDPRFDPRFQRGYAGPDPEPPTTPAAPSPVGWTPPPETQRPVNEAPREAPAAPVVPPAPALDDSPPRVDEAGDVPPRRNPFSVVLLVGAVALLAAGGWLTWSFAGETSAIYDPEQQSVALAEQLFAPTLLIGGLAGLIGWLILGALRAAAFRERR